METNFEDALGIALVGMLAAFLALGAISALIALIGYIDRRGEARASVAPAPRAAEVTPTVDDLTLVILSAAVATVLQGRGRIRRIQRIGPSGGWAMKGRVTVQGSHVMTGHLRSRGTK